MFRATKNRVATTAFENPADDAFASLMMVYKGATQSPRALNSRNNVKW